MHYANMLRTKVDNTVTKKDQTDKDKLTLLHKRLFHRGRHVILRDYNNGLFKTFKIDKNDLLKEGGG